MPKIQIPTSDTHTKGNQKKQPKSKRKSKAKQSSKRGSVIVARKAFGSRLAETELKRKKASSNKDHKKLFDNLEKRCAKRVYDFLPETGAVSDISDP